MGNHCQKTCHPFIIRSTQNNTPEDHIHSVSIINRIVIFVLVGMRPILGPAACRYEITCGNYAVIQLKTKSLVPALYAITKRLISCNPFW